MYFVNFQEISTYHIWLNLKSKEFITKISVFETKLPCGAFNYVDHSQTTVRSMQVFCDQQSGRVPFCSWNIFIPNKKEGEMTCLLVNVGKRLSLLSELGLFDLILVKML